MIRLPHIGWNALSPHGGAWRGGILDGVIPGSSMYFVHSFAAQPQNRECILATCDYEGIEICAGVRIGNAYGFQFHPEKSGPVGLQAIANFASL